MTCLLGYFFTIEKLDGFGKNLLKSWRQELLFEYF